MLNYIWIFMILISFIVSLFSGTTEAVSDAIMSGARDASSLCISLLGTMCLWTGLSKIAEKSGLCRLLSKLMSPVLKFIFPKLKDGSPAKDAVVMNIVANLLGMGNAATPLGLKAMKELKKLSPSPDFATDEMCMFALLNTASFQLIPSTLISLRQTFSSSAPGEIILPVWITSFFVVIFAMLVGKFFSLKKGGLR